VKKTVALDNCRCAAAITAAMSPPTCVSGRQGGKSARADVLESLAACGLLRCRQNFDASRSIVRARRAANVKDASNVSVTRAESAVAYTIR
jgi:hypothetical protein